MLFKSLSLTKQSWVSFNFLFFDFFVKIWFLNACFLLILPVPVTLNLFLALDLVFILLIDYFFTFFGLTNIIIFFPSSTGNCSTFPYSSNSWANFNNKICPCSLKMIDLPLKKTNALSFAPSSRNFIACFFLNS